MSVAGMRDGFKTTREPGPSAAGRTWVRCLGLEAAFWLVWFIYALFSSWRITSDPGFALRLSASLILYFAAIHHVHLWLLNRFLFAGRGRVYAGLAVVWVLLASSIFQIIFRAGFGYENPFVHTVVGCVVVLLIPMAMQGVRRAIHTEIQLARACEAQREVELDLLKSQVNPHFLYNTLNNLYGLSLGASDALPDMILALSSLMRYLTHHAHQKTVLLSQEAEFLKHYVDLECMRMVNPEKVSFEVHGDLFGVRIPPLLLIPFVENAFKHGCRKGEDALVQVCLRFAQGRLVFSVKNAVNPVREIRKSQASGTGLDNVQRRLELLYPNRHILEIQSMKGEFQVRLELEP